MSATVDDTIARAAKPLADPGKSEKGRKRKTEIPEDEKRFDKKKKVKDCACDKDAAASKVKREIAKTEDAKTEDAKNVDAKNEDAPTVTETGREGKDSYVYFYGKASPFSQHHPCHFKVEGKSFNCAEQYMMYMKAVVFKDEEMQKAILKTSDPVLQKRLGRKVKKFDGSVWNSQCEKIVWDGNYAKFSQNPALKASLLATEGRTLVEASGRDRKWGIGLGQNNPKAWKRATWRGQNKLGFILTSIRNKLMASPPGGEAEGK